MIIQLSALVGILFFGLGLFLIKFNATHIAPADTATPEDSLIDYIINGTKSIRKYALKRALLFFTVLIVIIFVIERILREPISFSIPIIMIAGVIIAGLNAYFIISFSTAGLRQIYRALQTNFQQARKEIVRLSVAVSFMTLGSLLLILSVVMAVVLMIVRLHFASGNQLTGHVETEMIVSMMALGFGTTIFVAFIGLATSIFGKVTDLTADSVGRTEYDLMEDDLRNPASIPDLVGDMLSKGMGMGLLVYDCVLFCTLTCIVMSLISLDQFHMMSEVALLHLMSQPVLILIFGGMITTLVILMQAIFLKRKQKVWEMLLLTYTILIVAVWGLEVAGFITKNMTALVSVGCGLGMIITLNHQYMVSEKSRRVDHVIKAFDSGAVSGFLRGLLGGILASIIPIGGVALSIAVIFGISGGFQDLLSGFHAMSLVLIAMMSPVPLLISLGVVGAVSDNVKGISEMVMADEEVKKNAKELDISGTEDVSLVKSIIGVAGIMSCLIILVVMIKQILVTIGLKAQGQKVFLGDIHVSHTMLTDVGRINISDLTIQKLIHLLDLSILHPDVILGLLLGSIVIVVMCGLLMGAVQSGVASLTDAVREQMATKPGIWSGESLPDYHDIIEKASMKTITWVRRILLLAVVIPFISLVTIKLDGTLGLLVGMISTGVIVSLVSNYSGTMWQMAKKKMEITDENYAASSQYLSSIFVDGIGDVLKDTVAPSIYVIIKIMGILALVFGSVTLTLSL